MTESMSTVETGTVHHPHALSSTLNAPKAFLPVGAAWLRTAVYGVPAYLLYPSVNPVIVGRTVTWLLSLVLTLLVIFIVKKRSGEINYGLLAALILVASSNFFFASHSARPDLLKGLIILLVSAWLSRDSFVSDPSRRKWFAVTFVALLSAIWLPFHLYFHHIAICGVAFILYRAYREREAWLWVVLGVVASLVVTAAVQYLLSGELLLSGPEGHKAEFNDVTRDIPALRIFSLSAQHSVLQRRIEMLWDEASLMFLLVPIAFALIWRYRKNLSGSSHARLICFALASLIVWYFMQRIHPAYTIQMLPLFVTAVVVGVSVIKLNKLAQGVACAVVIVIAGVSLVGSLPAADNGRRWTEANERAVKDLRSKITPVSGEKPLVMVEASASMPLLNDTSIQLMSTHFQFFPIYDETISQTIDRHGVDYCILFNTAHYGYDRNAIDPLVKTIQSRSDLIGVQAGDFFDISKDYFHWQTAQPHSDTLFLYKLRK
jgi:hypothetical protein